jgi:hypothetical protein
MRMRIPDVVLVILLGLESGFCVQRTCGIFKGE